MQQPPPIAARRQGLDAVQVFLASLRKCPRFTREEQAELCRRRDAGDAEALELLTRSVLPWTYRIACRSLHDIEEAICAATMSAWMAARRLDPAKGKIATYGFWAAARYAKLHRMRFQNRAVTLPAFHTRRKRKTFHDAYRRAVAHRGVSLHCPILDGDDVLGATLAADSPTPAEQAADDEQHRHRREWVGWILAKMQPVYAEILRGRMQDETLENIGSEVGMTRERIRQIENQAHKSFRRWAERFPLLTFHRRSKMSLLNAPNPPRLMAEAAAKKTLSECIAAITSADAVEVAGEEEILREEIAELKRQIARRLEMIKMLNRFCGGKPAPNGAALYERIRDLLAKKGPMEAKIIAAAMGATRSACYQALKKHGELFAQPSPGTWAVKGE